METKVGKFSFVVPEGHARAGEKIERTFDYTQVTSEDEATQTITDKKWSLVNMVNDILKANARANAYQSALMPFRPSEVPVENIVERMVRDYIRIGVSEEAARASVQALMDASK